MLLWSDHEFALQCMTVVCGAEQLCDCDPASMSSAASPSTANVTRFNSGHHSLCMMLAVTLCHLRRCSGSCEALQIKGYNVKSTSWLVFRPTEQGRRHGDTPRGPRREAAHHQLCALHAVLCGAEAHRGAVPGPLKGAHLSDLSDNCLSSSERSFKKLFACHFAHL